MKSAEKPIALDAYEKLARGYSAIAETKAENGYNEHPAIRSRIGDVGGLSVLDAGCGPGFLIRDLIEGGASSVAGFDSPMKASHLTFLLVASRFTRAGKLS